MSLSVELPSDLLEELAERLEERLPRRRWAHIETLADYLGCDVRRARDLRERGLPAYKIGKKLVFDLREVDQWIEREGVKV